MGIKLFKEPELEKPDLICGWPVIGNIGLIAVDTLRESLKAEEFGEIESCDFFLSQEGIYQRWLARKLRVSQQQILL